MFTSWIPAVENYENKEEVLAQWLNFKVRNTAPKALEEAFVTRN